MSTRPDKTKRTRTSGVTTRHNKFDVVTVKPKNIDDAFEYDRYTGLIYERFAIKTTERTRNRDKYFPSSTIEYKTPFPVGKMDRHGFIIIKWRGQSFAAHRLAYRLMVLDWPNCYVRHKNGLRFDNRWSNLTQAGAKK